MPPSPSGVAMAAMVSASSEGLLLLEPDTGFLVAFAVEKMEQLRIGSRVKFFPQVFDACEERPQIGLGLHFRHFPDQPFQFHQRGQ